MVVIIDGNGKIKKAYLYNGVLEVTGGGGGTVTSVTATTPLSSTGGTTPNISITQATALTDGYLSATDWNTFNNKQDSLTLTTTGTSGPATLVGSTLNVPQYGGVTANDAIAYAIALG